MNAGRSITNLLIVSGCGFQGWGLVQALRNRPATRIVVCDIHAEGVTRYAADHYEVVPPVVDPNFDECLLALVAREQIYAIFPSIIHELPCLARLAPELEATGIRFAVSTPDILGCLLDKMDTTLWLASQRVPVQLPTAFAEAEAALPLLGKPRHGWGAKGMRSLRTLGDIRKQDALGDCEEHIWVPLLENFSEYSADVALGPQGQRSTVVVRRRLRTSGGFSVISESVENDAIARVFGLAIKALLARGAHGLFNLQVISPSHGEAFVSDINPRIGTSASHALAEGINLAEDYLAMCATDSIASAHPYAGPLSAARRPQIKSIRLLQDRIIPRITRPKGVIFDLDDTLIDHKRWVFERLLLAVRDIAGFNHAGMREEDMRVHIARIVDEGERTQLVDRVAAALGVDKSILLDAYRRVAPSAAHLYPDVPDTLSALRTAGIAIAVLTDNPPQTQMAKFMAMPAAVKENIDQILFARNFDGEKPNPGGFVAAATALGLAPGDCAMVGDNYFRDAVGAIAAGYNHAFVVHRDGAFVQTHAFLATVVAPEISARIHRVDDLATLREAVLQS